MKLLVKKERGRGARGEGRGAGLDEDLKKVQVGSGVRKLIKGQKKGGLAR